MSQVIEYFTHLFSTEGLPPRWLCGHWPPFQGWFYIFSDLGIWSSYFAIPFLLLSFIRQKNDIPFLRIFWLFAAFILACGLTHFMDALMFWWPAYRLSGLVYFITAVISWITVFALIPVIPQALALKSPLALEKEIREREQAEKLLRQSEARFRMLIDNVTDYAIFYLSPEGFVSSWNQGAAHIKGYQANEIIGQHFSKFYPQEAIDRGYPAYELEMASQAGRFEDEGWRIRKDGSKFWANVVITAMRDEDGHLLGFSKVSRDLTERKNAEDKLQQMNVDLEALVALRTESLRKSLEREQLAMMIVNSIRAESDLETILLKTINLLGEYTQADRCIFWAYNPDTQEYDAPTCEYHSSDSPDIHYIRENTFPALPVLSRQAGELEVISIADAPAEIQREGIFSEAEILSIQERSIQSFLSVPVIFDEKLLGRLQIHSIFTKREWSEETISMVQQVSDQVAIAIFHARILESLRNSEARKSAIMESALDAVIIMSQTGEVVEWNAAAERIFQYPRETVLGKAMELFIVPERYRQAHRNGVIHYLATGEGPIMNKLLELPALRADGTEFISELTITQIDLTGTAMFTGVVRDITDRKRSEQALIESEERFRTMADSAPIMIWMMNTRHEITYRNKASTLFYGFLNSDDGMGNVWEKRVEPEDLDVLVATISHAALTQQHYTAEYRLMRADGVYRWVLSTGIPRLSPKGELLGFVGTTVDIQDQKLATEALENRVQERTAQLQAANKELEAFSYSVSHDLRAPLRTVDGFSQAILELYESKLDTRGKDYLNRIRQGSQQMARLIDDMLQLSRLTRGELNVDEGVNLSQMATEIVTVLHDFEPERQVVCEIQPDLIVRGDKRLLQAVLQNLLGNAWKYTSKHEKAHIELGQIKSQNTAIYYVKDDGAGFDMQYADKLFGAFQRLHGVEEFPGTGVGLASVARIIHRHGGEVWADAEVEKGATFYFTLQAINSQEMENAKSFQQSHSPC